MRAGDFLAEVDQRVQRENAAPDIMAAHHRAVDDTPLATKPRPATRNPPPMSRMKWTCTRCDRRPEEGFISEARSCKREGAGQPQGYPCTLKIRSAVVSGAAVPRAMSGAAREPRPRLA